MREKRSWIQNSNRKIEKVIEKEKRTGGKDLEKNVICEILGNVGIVKMNRSKKLNAFTRELTTELTKALEECERNEKVSLVILRGSTERAFSAGGDLRSDQLILEAEGLEQAVGELRGEYELGEYISKYSKPLIAYMNGITMGGGAGMSMVAKFRIVTETTRWAMPEMKIGFFPDVGMGYFFSQMKRGIGKYLAMTSNTIVAEDCIWIGAADYKIQSQDYEKLQAALVAVNWTSLSKEMQEKKIEEIIQSIALEIGMGELEKNQKNIETYFEKDSLEELLDGLNKNAKYSEFAKQMEEGMQTNSPLSMAVTWEQMKRCERLSLEESYQLDTILARNFLSGKDMFEGVRAILVDKTGDPKWEYQKIEDIPREVVLSYFE